MRSALFCNIAQRMVVNPYRHPWKWDRYVVPKRR